MAILVKLTEENMMFANNNEIKMNKLKKAAILEKQDGGH